MPQSPLEIPALLRPVLHKDARGHFVETYSRERLAKLGIDADFVQDNQSLSRAAFTLRGLHFQHPPFAQAKLVRVLTGRILDVAVDIRRGSPTYGKHVSAVLTAEGFEQLYVPEGYAHGFLTLEPDTTVAYKTGSPYAPKVEGGLRWDDPALAIAWPGDASSFVLSDRDRTWPPLGDYESPFPYAGRSLDLLQPDRVP